jgi:hypothetical protein
MKKAQIVSDFNKLPKGIREALKDALGDVLKDIENDETYVQVAEVTRKELFKFRDIIAEEKSIEGTIGALQEVLKSLESRRDDWWSNIRDKYEITDDNLKIDKETGIISKRVPVPPAEGKGPIQ